MEHYIFRIGKWYYEGVRCGVNFTTDINEAETFSEITDIEFLLQSESYGWIRDEMKEKIEQVGEPIVIETIIKL